MSFHQGHHGELTSQDGRVPPRLVIGRPEWMALFLRRPPVHPGIRLAVWLRGRTGSGNAVCVICQN